jgi:GLTT repeat-containing protein
MKILYVLPLLAASALHVGPQANAATLDNGRNINGVELNGRNLNGRNVNGLATNGLATNGLSTNGLSTNGVDREEAIGHATTVILKDGERVSRQ